MTPANEAVRTMLASFPVAALTTDEQRQVFEKIRSRFDQAPDVSEELKNLYKVKGFSDFAAAVMWIVDRTQKDPTAGGARPGDEEILVSAFGRAFGESVSGLSATPSSAVGTGTPDEKDFASRLEKLSEAVQSGIEGRGELLEALLIVCEAFVNTTTDDKFKECCSLLGEFLKYIVTNELLDDVRVINILSNVSSTVTQWALSPSASRAGLMEEAAGMMRDFKSHFE